MNNLRQTVAIGAFIASAGAFGAWAQEAPLTPVTQTPMQETPAADAAPPAGTAASTEAAPISEDEMADLLNSRQQIQQTWTFTRTVNGEKLDEERRTITYDRDDPVRASEARRSAFEAASAAFARKVLTRTEAFEEAKLDFVSADANRDGALTADEFVSLVIRWRDNHERSALDKREQRYVDFITDLDPAAEETRLVEQARAKFALMAGAAPTLSQQEYIREYLLEFDAFDVGGKGFLKGDEVLRFRAANAGDDAADYAAPVADDALYEALPSARD